MQKNIKYKLFAILISVFMLFSIMCVMTFSNANAKTAKAEGTQAEWLYGADDFYFVSGVQISASDLNLMRFRLMLRADAFETIPDATIIISSNNANLKIENTDITLLDEAWADTVINEVAWRFYDVNVWADSYRSEFNMIALLEYAYNSSKQYVNAESLTRSYVQVLRAIEESSTEGEDVLVDYFGDGAEYQFVKDLLEADSSGYATSIEKGTFWNVIVPIDMMSVARLTFKNDSSVRGNRRYLFTLDGSSESIEFLVNEDRTLTITNSATSVISNVSYDYYVRGNGTVFYHYLKFTFLDELPDGVVFIPSFLMGGNTQRQVMIEPLIIDNTDNLQEEIEEWKSKYEAEAAKITEANKKLNDANNRIVELEQRRDELLEQIETLTAEQETEKQNIINEYEDTIAQLKADYEARIQTITEERDQLQTQLDATILAKQNEINNLAAEKESLETQLAQKEMEIQTLQNSLSATTNNYNAAAAELEAKKIEYNQLKADYDQVCAAQDGDTKAMISTINDYRAKIAEKEKKIKELQDAVNELESENEELQNQKGTISMGCSGNIGDGGTLAVSMTAMIVIVAIILWRKAYARKKK